MITVEFSNSFCLAHPSVKSEREFENFTHLREVMRQIHFAKKYRMRTHENEFGRVTHRDFFAVYESETPEVEVYLGNIVLTGDKQTASESMRF